MSWYAESLLGASPQALAKLPAEIVMLLQEKGLKSAMLERDVAGLKDMKLPEELMDMVRGYLDADGHGLPMSVEEAREHRKELMRERGAYRETLESGWQEHSYSFCEH